MTFPEDTDETRLAAVTISLNGKSTFVPAGSSVNDLLEARELVQRLVVVEINGEIVARSRFAETLFNDGDIVEMVHFVGGG